MTVTITPTPLCDAQRRELLNDLRSGNFIHFGKLLVSFSQDNKTTPAKLLLDLHDDDGTGRNALHHAAHHKDGLAFLHRLFDPKMGIFANPSDAHDFLGQADSAGETPILYAIRHADRDEPRPEFLAQLLHYGSAELLDARNARGQGPMHMAAELDNAAVIRYLCRHVDPDVRDAASITEVVPGDRHGDHPAHVAARMGNTKAFVALAWCRTRSEWAVRRRNKMGRTASRVKEEERTSAEEI
ncbi:hypothetical protein B0T16DRAFT_386273 [Cercophora newfieldiana]|uniref:Ankyrin repeat protein n=1 Tax=Cercophora newfieldiana TaxID=92897 RepID=A0AA39YSG0_9PEZI|nr:hypothetical protein B0T16DRAFT_386273 [Cercophora newfieldiana]